MLTIDPVIYTQAISVPKVHIDEAVAGKGGRKRLFQDLSKLGDWNTQALREYAGDNHIPFELTDSIQVAANGPYCGVGGPLAQPYTVKGDPRFSEKDLLIPNRLAIAPMEGWDGNIDGSISDAVSDRWLRFGRSGAGLIWGVEATAVRHDGRANPNQLVLNEDTFPDFKKYLDLMKDEHRKHFIGVPRPVIGLQLTHSGRFASPNKHMSPERMFAYEHPNLKNDGHYMSDTEIDELVKDFVKAAVLAQKAGFDFVDIKHCHGYFGHELLSAYDRKDSRYGGSFENRTRFLRSIVEGIRREAPGLHIGVRLSAYDFVPFIGNPKIKNIGEPADFSGDTYRYAFGGDGSGQGVNLEEPVRFLNLLEALGIKMVNVTAGSPYYSSHIQRPTDIPPSDAYYTPVDPLATMALQIEVTAAIKKMKPDMFIVGSAYSYAQGYFDRAAEYTVANGKADAINYGRMALPYPSAAADILNGMFMKRVKDDGDIVGSQTVEFYAASSRNLCKLLSLCTTFPRNGHESDCPLRKGFDFSERLRELKRAGKVVGRLDALR